MINKFEDINEVKKKRLLAVVIMLIIMLLCLILIITTFTVEFFGSGNLGSVGSQLNYDTDHDGIPDINIDIDGDGKPDFNIDTNGDSKPDKNLMNQDTNIKNALCKQNN